MNDNISAIDKAIQAAQARKAAKLGLVGTLGDPTSEGDDKPSSIFSTPRVSPNAKVSSEVKLAKQKLKEAAIIAKEAERVARRAKKKEAIEGGRQPHMNKVDKAAQKLPTLDDRTQLMFNDVVANFSASEVSSLAFHLQHFNRVKATERALQQVLAIGNKVRINSGDARFVGQTGSITKVQRIRCYVTIENVKKPVYLFTSDVEQIDNEQTVEQEDLKKSA